MRTQKHTMLSIVVLNMAKYTIISLILTDFVPIFSYSTCFEKFLGVILFKKSPNSQIDFRGGGQPISKKSLVKKSPISSI